MLRKRTLLLSHVFVFSGAALSTACVAAEAPELLMIGRVLVGINSGELLFSARTLSHSMFYALRLAIVIAATATAL